ncbi:MAG: hypothetical protein KY468_10170 [Armatimonadetes bacterium]|nr:hypothetical protein [Armatimonadota bacterium]
MTIQIDLTPEVEQRLREEAEKQGQDLSAFTRSLIEERLGIGPNGNGGDSSDETLDKALAGHIGLIDVGPSELPQKSGNAFSDGLVEKYRRQGLTV